MHITMNKVAMEIQIAEQTERAPVAVNARYYNN